MEGRPCVLDSLFGRGGRSTRRSKAVSMTITPFIDHNALDGSAARHSFFRIFVSTSAKSPPTTLTDPRFCLCTESNHIYHCSAGWSDDKGDRCREQTINVPSSQGRYAAAKCPLFYALHQYGHSKPLHLCAFPSRCERSNQSPSHASSASFKATSTASYHS